MRTTPHEELEIRRIILLRGKILEVLLGVDGMLCTLPEVQIPRWQRVAEHLTATVSETFGIDGVLVSSLQVPTAGPGSRQICYEIMEPCGPQNETPDERDWMAVDGLDKSAFRDPCDFQALRQAIAQCMAHAKDTSHGPFGKLGWFLDLRQWVQEQIRARGLHLNGSFRQLNACPTFSLIRFETDGPAVWFKAVGAPNQREYPLTLALARLFPRLLPQIIATRPEWNGWIALEAEGLLLRECSTLASWEPVARDLAELQSHSLGRGLHLLDLGARDLRARTLADLVEPFFQIMSELMERQTKMPPAPLSRGELRCLSTQVQDSFAVLEETDIPSTLGHLDLNPGNIICSPTACVILDWAEAYVGHPFLTFQYLLEHFRRTFPHDQLQETRLVARYSSPWRAFVSEDHIRRALEVAPLAAVFACAVGNEIWTNPRKLEDPRSAGYLRSLTRRMQREAHALMGRSVSSCLS